MPQHFVLRRTSKWKFCGVTMCHGHWANFQKRKFNFLVPIERIDFFVCGKAPSPASQKESQTQPNPLGFLLAGSSTRGQSVTITRPGKAARPHTVPLTPLAATALQGCNSVGAYALSVDGGVSHISAYTLSRWAQAAGAGIAEFQTKRIRSGVETMLAAARISQDYRGRLQSHGIAGVQNRHYDGHHYLDEKRHALDVLLNQLENSPVTGDNVRMLKDAPGDLRVMA
jgi:hypothetical protein